jgi:hypothetical protein
LSSCHGITDTNRQWLRPRPHSALTKRGRSNPPSGSFVRNSLDERASGLPYPGIKAFEKARESRDFYFPGRGRFEHQSWMPD